MLFYYIIVSSISFSSLSLLFFLYIEIQKYINNVNNNKVTIESVHKENIVIKKEEKYEDKYLEKVRNLNVLSTNNNLLKSYTNNIIFEKTPLGNVAMYYDVDNESFIYFSDNTIPYRFLEVVARKYVLIYNCSSLYIDMEKLLERKKLSENNCNKLLNNNTENNVNSLEKKSVFAKFKSYNKEAGSGRVNTAPPPKNSIPSNRINVNNSEQCVIKEHANRYICKGRFSNFDILKKIDRKKIDKKYALSFSEFKKFSSNPELNKNYDI